MCAHNRKLESQKGSGCAHNRKWNHRGMCAYNRKWNHRRVWVYAHNRKLESGGSGCMLTYRKLKSQEGLGVCSQQEAGITGGV